jgi:hypothetical protein
VAFTSSGTSCDELGVGSREITCTLPLQIKNTVGLKHRGIHTKRPTLVFFLVPTKPVLYPDSMGSLNPYPDPDLQSGSGFGTRRAKMTQKHRKKLINFITFFEVLDVLF